jgi:hypothetical protein
MQLFGRRNRAILDEWTFVHFASGIVLAQTGFGALQTLVLHSISEAVENTEAGSNVLRSIGWDRSVMDSPVNIATDTIFAMAGWWLGNSRK